MLSLKGSWEFPARPAEWTCIVAENWFAWWVNSRVLIRTRSQPCPTSVVLEPWVQTEIVSSPLTACLLPWLQVLLTCFIVRVVVACIQLPRQCKVSRVELWSVAKLVYLIRLARKGAEPPGQERGTSSPGNQLQGTNLILISPASWTRTVDRFT